MASLRRFLPFQRRPAPLLDHADEADRVLVDVDGLRVGTREDADRIPGPGRIHRVLDTVALAYLVDGAALRPRRRPGPRIRFGPAEAAAVAAAPVVCRDDGGGLLVADPEAAGERDGEDEQNQGEFAGFHGVSPVGG